MDNGAHTGQKEGLKRLKIKNNKIFKKQKAGEWDQKRNPIRSDAELAFSALDLMFSGLIYETQIIQPSP